MLKMPVIFGDCHYFKGKVAGKRLENGLGLVDIELWGDNQFGQTTIKGSAVIELPRR